MTESRPLVTILMATCNGEDFVEEQLLSIVRQDYSNLKLLIADDASDDSTYEILVSYARSYDWIHLSQNRERVGLIKNFEKLLESAGGDCIAFCDQDDVWDRGKISRLVAAMESEMFDGPMLVHSDLRVVDEKLKVLFPSFFVMRSYRFSEEKQVEAMLGRCGVMGNTMMVNQKLKSMVLPFPEGLVAHDYWIALVNELFGKRITLEERLVSYRIHHSNSSNTIHSIKPPRCRMGACLRRDYRLPFMGNGREKVLAHLIEHYNLDPEDRKRVLCFMDYLEFKKSRAILAYVMIKHDFLIDYWPYRLKIAWKILWKKR